MTTASTANLRKNWTSPCLGPCAISGSQAQPSEASFKASSQCSPCLIAWNQGTEWKSCQSQSTSIHKGASAWIQRPTHLPQQLKIPFTRFQQSLLQPTRFTLIMLQDVAQQRTSQQSQHAEPCHWSVQVSICILLQVGFFLYHLEKFLPCQCGAVPPAISLSFLRILGFYLDLWQSPALRLEAKRLKKRKPSGWVQTSRRRNQTWLIHLWSDHKASKLHRPHLSGGLKHKSLAMSQPHENAG